MMSSDELKVLFDGYSRVTESGSAANCTCTLIKSLGVNIIVDTMTAWDGDEIIKALEKNNVKVDDIHYVVCSHGHSDHIGCNYLFKYAMHIVGFGVSKKNIYYDHDFKGGKDYIINQKVKVIPTPGHTLQDVTVLAEINGLTYAITGDLFEREEDLDNDQIWKDAGSDSEQFQLQNRAKILKIADWIVPGHGPKFQVSRQKCLNN